MNKLCSKCKQIKDINLFCKDKKNKDGFSCVCKDCRKEYKKRYHIENKEFVSKKRKEYRGKQKESIPNFDKIHREKYKDSIKITLRKWNINNQEYAAERKREYYKRHFLRDKESRANYRKKYESVNKDRISKRVSKFRKNNPEIYAYRSSLRRVMKNKATPAWLTNEQKQEIKQFYIDAKYLTLLTKIKFEVDHIVPLKGVGVCGLHVPWNLQLLTQSENRAKSNKFVCG